MNIAPIILKNQIEDWLEILESFWFSERLRAFATLLSWQRVRGAPRVRGQGHAHPTSSIVIG